MERNETKRRIIISIKEVPYAALLGPTVVYDTDIDSVIDVHLFIQKGPGQSNAPLPPSFISLFFPFFISFVISSSSSPSSSFPSFPLLIHPIFVDNLSSCFIVYHFSFTFSFPPPPATCSLSSFSAVI